MSFALHEQIQQQTVEHVPQNFPVTVETASFSPVLDASSIPDVTFSAFVPVIKHVSLAPDDTHAAPARLAPAPVTEHTAPARVAPSFCGWVNPQFSTGLVNPQFSQPVWRFLRQRLLGHSSLRLPVRPIRNIFVVGETTRNIVAFHPVQEQVTVQEITEIQVIERIQGAD